MADDDGGGAGLSVIGGFARGLRQGGVKTRAERKAAKAGEAAARLDVAPKTIAEPNWALSERALPHELTELTRRPVRAAAPWWEEIPETRKGGRVARDGVVRVHAGEVILPARIAKRLAGRGKTARKAARKTGR